MSGPFEGWIPVLVVLASFLALGCAPPAHPPSPASEAADPVGDPAESVAEAPGAIPGTTYPLAVTIDDLPLVSVLGQTTERQQAVMGELIETLEARGVPAIGFVNEVKLFGEGGEDGGDGEPIAERVALLEAWLDAGLELGNHSYSHPDLHRVELEVWLEDVERGEVVTRRLLEERGEELAYFRHPFLHTGRDEATRDRVEAFLAERGVAVAPVTVDNSEWIFAAAYDRASAAGDEALEARVAEAYIDYMVDKLTWFEGQAEKLFGRPIAQTLLIHANRLNAHHLGALLDAYEARGARFVPLAEVLEDPAYGSPDTWFGFGGISWLDRWALARMEEQGERDPEFFRGEPETPQWVMEVAEIESE